MLSMSSRFRPASSKLLKIVTLSAAGPSAVASGVKSCRMSCSEHGLAMLVQSKVWASGLVIRLRGSATQSAKGSLWSLPCS